MVRIRVNKSLGERSLLLSRYFILKMHSRRQSSFLIVEHQNFKVLSVKELKDFLAVAQPHPPHGFPPPRNRDSTATIAASKRRVPQSQRAYSKRSSPLPEISIRSEKGKRMFKSPRRNPYLLREPDSEP